MWLEHLHIHTKQERPAVKLLLPMQAWRPLRGPVQDSPLAVCDAATVSQEDLVPIKLIFPERVGSVYSVSHNPKHRWNPCPHV